MVSLTILVVQMAREMASRGDSANDLRRQALAAKLHEEVHDFFQRVAGMRTGAAIKIAASQQPDG